MSESPAKSAKSTIALPSDCAPLLADIKARVQSARVKAGLAANRELLALYWDNGCVAPAKMADLLDETRQLVTIFTTIDKRPKQAL